MKVFSKGAVHTSTYTVEYQPQVSLHIKCALCKFKHDHRTVISVSSFLFLLLSIIELSDSDFLGKEERMSCVN